jgi:hypothetical protein
MFARIASVAALVAALLLLVDVRPARSEGWSWLNPFASAESKSQVKKPVTKATKKAPSMWDKMTSGTKSVFDKTGETLGLKKPAPKKRAIVSASPKPPVLQPPKRTASKPSWVPSILQPSEPEKPKRVTDWMSQARPEF